MLSCLGVPLGAEPSQDKVKKLNLLSFTQAVTQPGRQIEGGTTNKDELMLMPHKVPNLGNSLLFILSEALPIVPPKLVKRIVKGEYVDMAELLNDNMEVERRRALFESELSSCSSQQRPGCREIPDILSWLYCFSLYAAVICCNYPEKAKQLWAYQAMMINEARQCGGWGWVLYDAAFCQQITSLESADFSRLNQSLYSTTILAYGNRRQCCPTCMLLDHTSEECALYVGKPTLSAGGP